VSSNVRPLLSHRNWEMEGLSSLIIMFQKDGFPSPWKRQSWIVKLAKVFFFFKDLLLRGRNKEFMIISFLK
jgi:hypothetical protein